MLCSRPLAHQRHGCPHLAPRTGSSTGAQVCARPPTRSQPSSPGRDLPALTATWPPLQHGSRPASLHRGSLGMATPLPLAPTEALASFWEGGSLLGGSMGAGLRGRYSKTPIHAVRRHPGEQEKENRVLKGQSVSSSDQEGGPPPCHSCISLLGMSEATRAKPSASGGSLPSLELWAAPRYGAGAPSACTRLSPDRRRLPLQRLWHLVPQREEPTSPPAVLLCQPPEHRCPGHSRRRQAQGDLPQRARLPLSPVPQELSQRQLPGDPHAQPQR